MRHALGPLRAGAGELPRERGHAGTMIHPDTELRWIGDEMGFGVFATRPIPRGTVVWVLDQLDLRLSPERVAELGESYSDILSHFAYRNGLGELVICWDLGRWVNHSCEPNVVSTGWEFDVAVRDIGAGEEITNDYATLNLDYDLACLCGAPGCRGVVRASDFELLIEPMDRLVRRALRSAAKVPQPLEPWMDDPRRVRVAARNPRLAPSIREHLCRSSASEPCLARLGS